MLDQVVLTDIGGVARCRQRLGDIALSLGKYVDATSEYTEALRQFRQVGDSLGEAKCLEGLGDIAAAQMHFEECRRKYEEARAVCESARHGSLAEKLTLKLQSPPRPRLAQQPRIRTERPPMNTTDLLVKTSAAPRLLLASDFDGTLSEIVTVPSMASLMPGALAALNALASAPGVTVAVVSGRSLSDLAVRTSGLDGAWRVGEHGTQISAPDGKVLREGGRHSKTLDDLERQASLLVGQTPGARVERKSTSVAIHWRQVAEADRPRAFALLEDWAEGATRSGLSLLKGRQVHEVRDPSHDKAGALAFILEQLPAGTLVLYAGDDTTDEPAIRYARGTGGIGIYIASAERPRAQVEVDAILESPGEWVALVTALAGRRTGRSK